MGAQSGPGATGNAADTGVLFHPLHIGGMRLRNRIMLPPHARIVGNPFRGEREAERHLAYWRSRAADGAAWIGGLNCFVGNAVIIPGFEPSGLGAAVRGDCRTPVFRDRAAGFADAIHETGAVVTAQLVMQGGMPHSASGVLANYSVNTVPHVLTEREVRWFVEEYAFSVGEIRAAGLDGAELHANHEDLLQLFLSPATNHRNDTYGGDLAGRMRFLTEILRAARDAAGHGFTLGVRLNMEEMFPGGYGTAEGIEIARALEREGLIDYIHCVVGNNWGAPSYIQPHHYAAAQWSPTARLFKQALTLPVVYTGRVADPVTAAAVIAGGDADVVGMARAMFADGQIVSKTLEGRLSAIRPCIGTNDCIHRVTVDGLRFGCSVNPGAGREADPPVAAVSSPRRILVAGGGPAGLELAGLLAEKGHRVALWERASALGGQMRAAARAQENASYADFIGFQERRLARLGVDVRLGHEATAANVRDAGADVVAVATGARPRRPPVPGAELPFVVDGRSVMLGEAEAGDRVVVIAMEDHMQPLTIAGFLADLGKQVQVIYPTPGIGQGVGRYSIGAPLAKLSAAGTAFRVMERVAAIEPGRLITRNIYSGARGEVTGFDSVVLACGGVAESALFTDLDGTFPDVHLLGDAYAPRRISFATRQAYELARII